MYFLEYIGIEKSGRKTTVEKKTSLRRDANDEELNRPEMEEKSDHLLNPTNVSSVTQSIPSTSAGPITYRLPSMSLSLTPIAAIAKPEMPPSYEELSASTSRIIESSWRIIQDFLGSGNKQPPTATFDFLLR